jgi:hypothetical protein
MTEKKEIKPEDWKNLTDESDLRKIYAESKQEGKSAYQEMKKRGHILDIEKYLK